METVTRRSVPSLPQPVASPRPSGCFASTVCLGQSKGTVVLPSFSVTRKPQGRSRRRVCSFWPGWTVIFSFKQLEVETTWSHELLGAEGSNRIESLAPFFLFPARSGAYHGAVANGFLGAFPVQAEKWFVRARKGS